MSAPHLVACVSAHGWGHLSQTVPMVAALAARLPGLRVTVRTGLPASLVAARFAQVGLAPPAHSVADDADFGIAMHDALAIDDATTIARYRALLADRHAALAREVDGLRALRADLVLSNVGWLPVAAAATLGLPAYAASSLNWADVLDGRDGTREPLADVVDWIRDAYRRADALFALEPGMPFRGLPRQRPIGPIARRGVARRDALRAALGLPPDARLAMVAFGGVPIATRTGHWRLPEGWSAIALTEGVVPSASVRDGRALGWPYVDLLASVDLLVCKPGYGTFAEAGFVARDTLSVPRPDWPESPWLERWLARHARFAPLDVEAFAGGRFDGGLEAIAAQPPRRAADGDGAAQIADAVAARMGVPPDARRDGAPGGPGRRV